MIIFIISMLSVLIADTTFDFNKFQMSKKQVFFSTCNMHTSHSYTGLEVVCNLNVISKCSEVVYNLNVISKCSEVVCNINGISKCKEVVCNLNVISKCLQVVCNINVISKCLQVVCNINGIYKYIYNDRRNVEKCV